MSGIPKKHITLFAATAIVVANMIGTGVFTSLGFQLLGLSTPMSIMLLWVVGGLIALCGAFVYGELGAAMPKGGGEYLYLSKLYHPALGFASGFVSSTVGFSVPVALAAIALGKYSQDVWPAINSEYIAMSVVIAITAIHASLLEKGIGFQNIATVIKVVLIVFFIICGFSFASPQPIAFNFDTNTADSVFSGSFAVSLIYVSYAYSGWNASAYISGEMVNAKRDLPKSLLFGTLMVLILYVLINFIFLYSAPAAEMMGIPDVGYVSARYIFGETGARMMGAVITLLLVSSISAMVIAGPRVAQSMGEDSQLLSFLGRRTKNGTPANAILLQALISLVLIKTASFKDALTYIGFSLSLFTFLTVLSVFILRYKKMGSPDQYRTWGYPVTPIIFLALTGWTMYYVGVQNFKESMLGLITVAVGLIIFYIDQNLKKKTLSS